MLFNLKGSIWIKSSLGQALDFHIKPVYLILALVLPLVIHVITHYLALAVGLDVAQTLFPTEIPTAPIILAIPYFILMMVIGGGQEEFGWRGYAQEPLQEKIGVIPASLVIGVIWGIWHLPLWFMAGDLHSAYSFLAFVAEARTPKLPSMLLGWESPERRRS